jgi:hypothetical protein
VPVIPATQEVGVRRIAVQGILGEELHETPSQPIAGCGGVRLPSQLHRESQIRGLQSRLAQA